MELPPEVSEKELLAAINNAVRVLAPSFTFGIYDLEDIRQEARMFGLEAVKRWDRIRPLENFLYSHIRNRLINLKRDKFRRNDPPCLLCHHGENKRSGHPSGEFCKKYVEWKRRNERKASLMRPMDFDHLPENCERKVCLESDVEGSVEMAEIMALIDERLDVDLRATYLQMLTGKSVPKARRSQVEEAIKEILRERGKEAVQDEDEAGRVGREGVGVYPAKCRHDDDR